MTSVASRWWGRESTLRLPAPNILTHYSNREWRPFGAFADSPPLHFYLLQFVGFAYMAYRFASRDYTVYGYLPDELFTYPRTIFVEIWPFPIMHYTSFQFIYDWISRPSPQTIELLQWIVIFACLCGLVGLLPRLAAWTAFLIGTHITGFIQATNADMDGGTLALLALLVLGLSPSTAHYGWRNGYSLRKRSVVFHWPIFLLLFFVGTFYTMAGLNKIVDVGPHWALILDLDTLAYRCLYGGMFADSRYMVPAICEWMTLRPLALFSAMVTQIGEAGFVSVLWFPRYRLFFAFTAIAMHFFVYTTAGINFLGSSAILILVLDWNAFARRIDVYYEGTSSYIVRRLRRLQRFDWFGRIRVGPASMETGAPECSNVLVVIDENGEVYYGADAFEQLAAKVPLYYSYYLLMQIPGLIYLARYRHEKHLSLPGERQQEPIGGV